MKSAILGISAYYHDSAACLLIDGDMVAAAQEERFVRQKHYPGFPVNAVKYVLSEAGIAVPDLAAIAFYDKPWLKFERLLETFHTVAPRGLSGFMAAAPVWIKEKLFMRRLLWKELESAANAAVKPRPPIYFPEHHLSHAASAFYPSPFETAAILTLDGVGEWATAAIGYGEKNSIRILRQLDFPHSPGLFYSAFTWYCGFRVNSGEYKLMGLAPYGEAKGARVAAFKKAIYETMLDLRDDGSFLLNLDYFPYTTSLRMCDDKRWERLFGVKRRAEDAPVEQAHADLALAAQQVIGEIVLAMARTARALTKSDSLALAGGVALNCVANAQVRDSGLFKNIWVQPAAGDAGGAAGAAYAALAIAAGEALPQRTGGQDRMKGALLGPSFAPVRIRAGLARFGAACRVFGSFGELCEKTAGLLAQGNVVGWFQGRMEFGPRALGNRSILADPRDSAMQKRLNLKIKLREGFRPFAPAVLAEDAQEHFDMNGSSPYMLFTAPIVAGRRKPLPPDFYGRSMEERLGYARSDLPAITHLDYSARVQTVDSRDNPRFHALLLAFKKATGCGVLVNTSFNVRGEPIVCTPEDAYQCFMRTDMDYLVIEDMIFDKKEQPHLEKSGRHFTD